MCSDRLYFSISASKIIFNLFISINYYMKKLVI